MACRSSRRYFRWSKREIGSYISFIGLQCCAAGVVGLCRSYRTGRGCFQDAPWRAYRQYVVVKAALYEWRPDRKHKHRATVKCPTLNISPLQLRWLGGTGVRGSRKEAGRQRRKSKVGWGLCFSSLFFILEAKTKQKTARMLNDGY